MNPLIEKNIFKKIDIIEGLSLNDFRSFSVKDCSRDIEILTASLHPPKKGLSYLEGQQRLLHDLASIELQAAELGIRTLIEFYDSAHRDFLAELLEITKEEAKHCFLCLKGLESLGGYWGMFPCHLDLWNVAQETDSLLERILKVHRYLEGSGLDASFSLLNRLKGFKDSKILEEVISVIAHDEVSHVLFGSKWFHKICEEENLNAFSETKRILSKFIKVLPKRRERIVYDKRKEAGFLEEEIKIFEDFQKEICI